LNTVIHTKWQHPYFLISTIVDGKVERVFKTKSRALATAHRNVEFEAATQVADTVSGNAIPEDPCSVRDLGVCRCGEPHNASEEILNLCTGCRRPISQPEGR
jgi:hypothetical protein